MLTLFAAYRASIPMRLLGIFLRLVAVLATLAVAQAQAPAPRVALVIGNADYAIGQLRNPINDAEAVAKSLEEAGFDVTVATDADQAAWRRRYTPSAAS